MVASVGVSAETSVDVGQVEVQRGLKRPGCARHPGGLEALVSERLRGSERGEVPRKLVGGGVLDVGHGVCDRTSMERIAGVADLGPQELEGGLRTLAIAVLAGGETVAEALHDLVGFGHAPSVSAATGFAGVLPSGVVLGSTGQATCAPSTACLPYPAFRGKVLSSSAGSVIDV